MTENRNKIFVPEDFDKPNDGDSWFKSHWKPFVGIFVVFVVICLVCYWYSTSESKDEGLVVSETQEVVTENSSRASEDSTNAEGADVVPGAEVSDVAQPADIQNPDAMVQETDEPRISTPSGSIAFADISDDVEAEAMKVIRGDYGVGQERKDRLGAKYQTIQNRVNELKREGVF